MQFWLDTADIEQINYARKLGCLFGVTTNPSILAEATLPPQQCIEKILEIQAGPVAVQVTSTAHTEMLEQARKLHRLSSRIIIKVPVTPEGLMTIAELRQEKIPLLATAVSEPSQFLLACLNNTEYAALYLGSIEQTQGDYQTTLKIMLEMIKKQNFSTQLMAASIKNKEQIITCASLGVPAITVPPKVFQDFVLSNELTQFYIEKFSRDWEKVSDSGVFV